MSWKDDANLILRQLGEHLDCGPMELNDNNAAMFSLDNENLGVIIYGDEGEDDNSAALIVNIILGPVTPSNGELLYDLLCANYMWSSTGGGTLAIDQPSGVLTLQKDIALPVDYDLFEDIFLHLAGAARYWQQTLEQESTAGEIQSHDMLRV